MAGFSGGALWREWNGATRLGRSTLSDSILPTGVLHDDHQQASDFRVWCVLPVGLGSLHFAPGNTFRGRPLVHWLHVRFREQHAGGHNNSGHLFGGRRFHSTWWLHIRLGQLTVAAAHLARVGGWVGEARLAGLPAAHTDEQVSHQSIHFVLNRVGDFRIG